MNNEIETQNRETFTVKLKITFFFISPRIQLFLIICLLEESLEMHDSNEHINIIFLGSQFYSIFNVQKVIFFMEISPLRCQSIMVPHIPSHL